MPQHAYGWSAADAAYAMGAFELAPGQALVVEGTSPECRFWNLCLWNPFLHTYDHHYDRVTINGAHVAYEPDGSWQIVISDADPGHPNWVSTAGRAKGLIWLRWFLPDETPGPAGLPSDGYRSCGAAHGGGEPMTAGVERPAAIRLNDLSDPMYPAAAQPMRDGAGRLRRNLATGSGRLAGSGDRAHRSQ